MSLSILVLKDRKDLCWNTHITHSVRVWNLQRTWWLWFSVSGRGGELRAEQEWQPGWKDGFSPHISSYFDFLLTLPHFGTLRVLTLLLAPGLPWFYILVHNVCAYTHTRAHTITQRSSPAGMLSLSLAKTFSCSGKSERTLLAPTWPA